jgi:uncharacterized protein YndB with AHSA1/START domain
MVRIADGLVVLPSGPDRIRVSLTVRSRSPQAVFRDWTDPDRLRRWWPPVARLEPRVGGTYEFEWPGMGWKLTGRFVRFDPGRGLSFSWRWDHEPAVSKVVDVAFRAVDGGTELTVEHGPYGSEARDAELRQEHLDGWIHFLGRLAVLDP